MDRYVAFGPHGQENVWGHIKLDVDLDFLKSIFTPAPGDEDLLLTYDISEAQYKELYRLNHVPDYESYNPEYWYRLTDYAGLKMKRYLCYVAQGKTAVQGKIKIIDDLEFLRSMFNNQDGDEDILNDYDISEEQYMELCRITPLPGYDPTKWYFLTNFRD